MLHRFRHGPSRWLAPYALGVALLAGGCGGDDEVVSAEALARVCPLLENGVPMDDLLERLAPDADPAEFGTVVGVQVFVFCPEQVDADMRAFAAEHGVRLES